ncbi:MAG: nucleoid occlusion factor SlmA [Gammaproteobacteria bacterium]|nr:nucleoid occlusion factor SlmA [Gammaproteobacteria bacterium]
MSATEQGSEAPVSRARQILEALAAELETRPGSRITTAQLARVVGVSEAALYRHFSGKAAMFEGLIAFAEESVFGAVARIKAEVPETERQCQLIAHTLLTFAARNPGISRVLMGDPLTGEHPELQARVSQFFDRLETEIRQLLRQPVAWQADSTAEQRLSVGPLAAMSVSLIEGRIHRFVRSRFQRSPLDGWEDEWMLVRERFG